MDMYTIQYKTQAGKWRTVDGAEWPSYDEAVLIFRDLLKSGAYHELRLMYGGEVQKWQRI